jgi:uncharacterized protein YlaI
MSKLLEQVKEIQARAHVCPECRGAKRIDTPLALGKKMKCWICDGKGTIDAPDIDALVGVIEVLVSFVQAYEDCDVNSDRLDELLGEFRSARKAAIDLLDNGLPGEEADTRC